MDTPQRYPLILGACAVALVTGCAQTGPARLSSQGIEVAPVYRVEQPVGTVAGQYAAGRIDLGEGRHEAAIARFRQALRLDPGFAAAHNGLGVAYGYLGQYEPAIDAFRAALRSGPPSAHVLNNLGYAQLQAGRLEEAGESLRRSLELDPSNVGTQANMRLLAQVRRERADGQLVQPVALSVVGAAAAAETTEARPALLSGGQPALPSSGSPPAPLAARFPLPLPVPDARFITALTQASAARTLGEKPNPAAYEIVVSRADETALVELASNVYELKFGGAPALGQPVPALLAQPAAVPGTAQALSAPGTAPSAGARSPWQTVRPVSTVPRRLPDEETSRAEAGRAKPAEVVVTAVPLRASRAWNRGESEGDGEDAAPAGGVMPIPTSFATEGPWQACAPRTTLASLRGLEVSNGAGVDRLAARTASQLERFGARVARLTNHQGYGVLYSEIHYRDGGLDGAKALQECLPVRARLVPVGETDLRAGTRLRLLVGQDMVGGPTT